MWSPALLLGLQDCQAGLCLHLLSIWCMLASLPQLLCSTSAIKFSTGKKFMRELSLLYVGN